MVELINAYNSTEFTVYNPRIIIKTGINNPELNELLKTLNITNWAIISAYNPYSKVLSKNENLKRHNQLKEKVSIYKFYEGEGAGAVASSGLEISLLILGITKKESIEIGKYFEQNAIVVGEIDGLPELELLV